MPLRLRAHRDLEDVEHDRHVGSFWHDRSRHGGISLLHILFLGYCDGRAWEFKRKLVQDGVMTGVVSRLLALLMNQKESPSTNRARTVSR
jgi:hypothetical protein